MTKHLLGVSLLAACFCSTALLAAENAPPERADGLHIDQVGKGPFYYDTAEGMDIRVRVLARGLNHPWSITWLPDGSALITEKNTAKERSLKSFSASRPRSLLAETGPASPLGGVFGRVKE